MTNQPSFFQQGEDLPLFSATAPRAKQSPFIPKVKGKQDTVPVNCTACMDTGNLGGKRCWCVTKPNPKTKDENMSTRLTETTFGTLKDGDIFRIDNTIFGKIYRKRCEFGLIGDISVKVASDYPVYTKDENCQMVTHDEVGAKNG
jgi:hypothetical protein